MTAILVWYSSTNTFQVRFGWEQKKEQLDLLHEILHREEYKNVTGLAEVLNVYLEEQYDLLDEEDVKLKQEEDEVAYERKRCVLNVVMT